MEVRTDRRGTKLSILGFGCMRFTKKGAGFDQEKAEQEILTAIRGGVNYFDTAYVYRGSEELLGAVLEKNHCRDQVYIATKLPHYLIKSRAGLERIFQEQLRRLRTDHVDYYLMHMLTDISSWNAMLALGVGEWIAEKKRAGQIGSIGFSYHGNTDMFKTILDAYDWDFCQIQYNYMDETSQAGREGLQYAAAKGLPVIIMEPLRGGKLVSLLPPAARQTFAATGKSPAEWGLRWLWNQPEVTVVLSGMNSLEMVRENVRVASEAQAGSLTAEDEALIDQVRREIGAHLLVPCTGCRYCMPCPAGVDIPGTFNSYNVTAMENRSAGEKQYIMCTVLRKTPSYASLCQKCGKCERHCPQHIPIRDQLQQAARTLEGLKFRGARLANRTLKLWK